MKNKRKILTFAITTLMVLSSLFVVNGSYAYWQGDVVGNTDTATATVNTGEWDQVFPWDPNTAYVSGDIVEYNGSEYEAKKDNQNVNPELDQQSNKFWRELK